MPPRKKLSLSLPSDDQFAGLMNKEYGNPTPNPKQRRIAIVGCYPESWEIWGFSRRNMGKLPRLDKWFELHDARNFDRYAIEVHGYVDYLRTEKSVVLAAEFPFQALIERYGPFFFSEGQSAWLLAHAITLNPSEIGLWGIECIGEYAAQRWCLQHFFQVAKDLGIPVTVPEGCTLMRPRKLYAYSPDLAK